VSLVRRCDSRETNTRGGNHICLESFHTKEERGPVSAVNRRRKKRLDLICLLPGRYQKKESGNTSLVLRYCHREGKKAKGRSVVDETFSFLYRGTNEEKRGGGKNRKGTAVC